MAVVTTRHPRRTSGGAAAAALAVDAMTTPLLVPASAPVVADCRPHAHRKRTDYTRPSPFGGADWHRLVPRMVAERIGGEQGR
jgi:hypothetical protein